MMEVAVPTLPTLYEHYTAGGVTAGLAAGPTSGEQFTLNGRNVTLYSGALHYFRVPAQYWRDRLRKARAAGLNAVETYVPWNLHEPQPGVYEWGDGSTEPPVPADQLDLARFLRTAQEEDLLAIVRPGPYICSEWEFGGLPSWLLRDPAPNVRTSDPAFITHVRRYFGALLPILAALQFTRGGPVIALQLENEYGSTGRVDKAYLRELKDLMRQNGIKELLFTSDSPTMSGDRGALPGVLQSANFQSDPENEFKALRKLQPGWPLMAMEYWTGWFDHWSEEHHTRSAVVFGNVLRRILQTPASVNLYMFHGGTNWAFLNGANIGDGSTDNKGYQPDTSSYDYDAPLTEAGDYTDKYIRLRDILAEFNSIPTRLPALPHETPRVVYPTVPIMQHLTLQDLLTQAPHHLNSPNVVNMESLPINNNTGQSYGYVVYRKTGLDIPANTVLRIGGRVCDTVMVLVNGVLKSPVLKSSADLNGFGYWRLKDSTLNLGAVAVSNATLDLVVENWGRNNFGKLEQFKQRKGLWQGPVSMNGAPLSDWEVVPLEFRGSWLNGLSGWREGGRNTGPTLYRTTLIVTGEPQDTYVDMRGWPKGFVAVNGVVLGRHANIGPQLTLYLPAPYLRAGDNDILVFEHFNPLEQVSFTRDPIFTTSTRSLPMEQPIAIQT